MSKNLTGVILENRQIRNTDVYLMKVKPQDGAGHAQPGQYVNIRCSEGTDPLLRRPISVLRSDPVTRAYEIGYEVRGRGTEYLSRLKPDDIIDVIGPLGNEFEIKGEYKKIAIVGGGIGVFPLVHLMESLPETVEAHTFFGFKNREKILWEILKDYAIDIQHVGSTAIPGLSAKPILDIAVAVKDRETLEYLLPIMAEHDYDMLNNLDICGEILARKGAPECRTHYIHMEVLNSEYWNNHILFRDYLLKYPQYIKEYDELKQNIVVNFKDERKKYTAEKNDFIQRILKLAAEEFNDK